MRVKIRKERDEFLAYFLDARRLVTVNELGATILEQRLNGGTSIAAIADGISRTHGIAAKQARTDVESFLSDIRRELEPEIFNNLEQGQLDGPIGLELEITTACNLRCIHCVQVEHAEEYMDTDTALTIIRTAASGGIFEISLMGGEPFRHPGVLRILDACQEHNLATNVVTNATYLNTERIARLAECKRLVVLVSLDGVGEMHDRIRGAGTFAKVDKALHRLVDSDIPVEVLCTLNNMNFDNRDQVLEYCRGLDIPCNFNLFKPFCAAHAPLILPPARYFDAMIELTRKRRDEGLSVGLSNASIVAEILGLEPRNECRATRSGLVVDVHGRMVPCPSLAAAGHYDVNDLPPFDENYLAAWRAHKTFEDFRCAGLVECQARSLIFSRDVGGSDPYGITAFREHVASKGIIL